jgi:hypothetical protein
VLSIGSVGCEWEEHSLGVYLTAGRKSCKMASGKVEVRWAIEFPVSGATSVRSLAALRITDPNPYSTKDIFVYPLSNAGR